MVVIAIVGVLAAILVPNVSRHIEDAQKRADIENARIVYEAVNMIILTDDKAAAGFYPKESNKYGLPVTVNEGCTKEQGYETYQIYPVARAYGNNKITHKNNDWGWSATDSSEKNQKDFIKALNSFEGFANQNKKVYVKMSCRSHSNGKNITKKGGSGAIEGGSSFRDGVDNHITDKWLICIRKDTNEIEIWAGNSNGKGANGPMYRLWPDPDKEYCVDKD
jgi:type II secretory pathway pseudopilin PulG